MRLRLTAISLLFAASFAAAQDGTGEWGKRERPSADQPCARIQEVNCAVCGAKCERVIVRGVVEAEWDTDYKVTRANFNSYPFVFMTCPKCSYSTYSPQFNKPLEENQKQAIEGALEPIRKEFNSYWDIPLSYSIRLAATTHKALDSGEGVQFEIYLIGSYLAREIKDAGAERDMQRKALSCLTLAIEKEEAYQRPKMRYLAGEICRRLEDYKTALEWFGKARPGANEDLAKLIDRQEILTKDAMDSKNRKK